MRKYETFWKNKFKKMKRENERKQFLCVWKRKKRKENFRKNKKKYINKKKTHRRKI